MVPGAKTTGGTMRILILAYGIGKSNSDMIESETLEVQRLAEILKPLPEHVIVDDIKICNDVFSAISSVLWDIKSKKTLLISRENLWDWLTQLNDNTLICTTNSFMSGFHRKPKNGLYLVNSIKKTIREKVHRTGIVRPPS